MKMRVGIMSQSKTHSIIEQVLNVGSGWLLSLLVWTFLIAPIYELDTTFMQNMEITIIFTMISIVRGYIWRRFFNRITEKQTI
jgi:membrane protein implicated in regulation of membrane protease activity